MNYLAHACLSYSEGQLIGNMIADFIRNRDRENFPREIQNGIRLHREIDTYTDAHPEIHEAKKIFRPLVRLYSGAFVDVSFDYFLAASLAGDPLKFKQFSTGVYAILRRHESLLPDSFKTMLMHMEKDDWLYNYQHGWGIEYSFRNVLNKARYLDKNLPVFEEFLRHKEQLAHHFDRFFPDLEAHSRAFAESLE